MLHRLALKTALCALLSSTALACSIFDGSSPASSEPPSIGEPNPDGKAEGDGCTTGHDCRSGVCQSGVCQASSSPNGMKNGDAPGGEKGPDGDPATPPPRFDDGIKNGTETDVDCGGPADGPRCAVGKTCKTHSDCESNGCAFDGTCAQRASCTQLEGGHTCGPNEGMSKQNDCCESAQVGQYKVDKYLVTAGRMRAFLTRLDGKVRDWATKLPADKWNQAYTAQLPNSIDGTPGSGDNANTQLGPFYGKRSCETGYHTGHTFWTPAQYGDTKDFSQQVLDTKALNCVPWWLLSALCVFDGGHLVTETELHAAYTNNGATQYPWGARGTYTTNGINAFAVQEYGYTAGAGNARKDGNGFLDVAAYIAAPGRRPDGYNTTGHADLVGNLLEWVSDRERQIIWKGSFERHAREADEIAAPIDNDPYMSRDKNNQPWLWNKIATTDNNPNGYYAIGGRCAY